MNVVIAQDLLIRSKEVWDASPFTFHGVDGKDAVSMAQAVQKTKAQAIILGTTRYPDSFFEGLEPGTLLQRYGVGYDSIPLELCRKKGLPVGYTPGALDAAVAEQTVALMLAAARRIAQGDQRVRAGAWGLEPGLDLSGMTLGLLGWGPIAQRVAAMAHHGLGMKVCVWRRTPVTDPSLPMEWISNKEDLVARCEVVSLHLKSVPELRRVVDGALLSRFKKGSIFINTARGALVDEGDLYDSLVAGHLFGAALDVFEREPYVAVNGKDLRFLSNVVLAPHAASNTRGANRAMAESCLRNLTALNRGKPGEMVLVPAP